MVLIAIWQVQMSENAVHLTGHKDSWTKQILREKWRPAGTGFEGSKFRDFSVPPGHMACMLFEGIVIQVNGCRHIVNNSQFERSAFFSQHFAFWPL